MFIAQHFVAGEGEAYPEDSTALTAFRCDSTNLPWIIFRAAFRAAHIEQIPPRARRCPFRPCSDCRRGKTLVGPSRAQAGEDAQAPSSTSTASSPAQTSLSVPSANVADGGMNLSPSIFQKRQPGQLPADLQRLHYLGFFLIF